MTASACIFGLAGPSLSADEAAFFREAAPWGAILFARNIETPDQLRRLTGDLRDACGRDIPIMIDQEGGRVARMTGPHWHEWTPPIEERGKTRALYLRYRIIADELRAVGIDCNCAPVTDVARPDTHPFLRNRCLGEEPEMVIGAARAVAQGLLAGGVLPVIKHVPGHGAGTADSHGGPVRVTVSRQELARVDFAPVRALSDLPMAMTGHMIFESIDDQPVTQSPRMIALIRDELGFGGLLVTDDLSMEALSGAPEIRAAQALSAGCDIVLHCNGDLDEMAAVRAALPAMSVRAKSAAEAALACRKPPDMVELADLIAEYKTIP